MTLTYDRIEQRSIHNAYLSNVALLDQLIYYRVRNVEIDLRADPAVNPYAGASDVNDWHVYHAAVPGSQGRGKLSDYLRILRAFHDATPEHEVITLTLELKGDDLGSAAPAFDPHGRHRTPDGLDARLRQQLGPNLFTPADLMRRAPQARTLLEAIQLAGWPTVEELRGKFIITIHEYNWRGDPRPYPAPHPWVTWRTKSMWEYSGPSGEHALARAAFIAPLFLWKRDDDMLAVPWAIFHTELKEDPGAGLHGLERAAAIRRNPRLARSILRSSDNDAGPSSFYASEGAHLNFLLTDHVDWHETPWVRTHNRFLYPFAPAGAIGDAAWVADGPLATARERQHLIEIAVRSGDIDGNADNFVFAYETDPARARTVWSGFVSVASDTAEVPRHAKGCLMARQSTDPGAPFFAVARHGDDEQLQIHWRLAQGGGTQFAATHFPYGGEGLHGEDAIFVRLVMTPTSNGGVRVEGEGSLDHRQWHRIGDPVTFSHWLPLQGIAACSNDPGFVTKDGHAPRFLFGNVTKNEVRYYASSFAAIQRIGHVVQHAVIEHSFPLPAR